MFRRKIDLNTAKDDETIFLQIVNSFEIRWMLVMEFQIGQINVNRLMSVNTIGNAQNFFRFYRSCVNFFVQLEIQVSILSDSGEERINVDEKSSFDDICNKIEEKMSKCQEYYVLIDNNTKKEITTNKIFDENVKRETAATSVLCLCQSKYTFHVTDETDSKENEFSFP